MKIRIGLWLGAAGRALSVAAGTGRQIRDSGSINIVDLSRNFAGVTITDLGPGQRQIAIRSISAGGRARPGRRREGIGRRIPRRIGDLTSPVHARSRPVRPRAL